MFADGTALTNPSVAQVKAQLGVLTRSRPLIRAAVHPLQPGPTSPAALAHQRQQPLTQWIGLDHERVEQVDERQSLNASS